MAASSTSISVADLSELNPLLSCALCSGYLRDPHTFCECLHTFCKVCLMRHLIDVGTECPTCHMSLQGDPVANGQIKPDQTLRGFINKLKPQLAPSATPLTPAAQDSTASASPTVSGAVEVTLDSLMRSRRRVTINSDAAEQCKYIVLNLVRADDAQPLLPRPFLRTLAALQLQDLRTFIAKRLVRTVEGQGGALTTTPCPVPPSSIQLLVNGAPVMGKEHTLEFVLKTQWRRGQDLIVEYR
ncbi:PcgF3, partial [Symbiodinium sp. KB8]